MATFPQAAWLDAYRERVNADPEMAVIGDWFTTALSFTFGEARCVVGSSGSAVPTFRCW